MVLDRLQVKDSLARSYGIRVAMTDDERSGDNRKRRFDTDEDDVDRRKREKRYPCEDTFLTAEERRTEVSNNNLLHASI